MRCFHFPCRYSIPTSTAVFNDFMIDHTSSSSTGVITILSKTRLSMYVVDDLLSCGMLLAKVGPMFTQYWLKPLAIFIMSVVVFPLTTNFEHELVTFFLFITSFKIRQDFFLDYFYFHSKVSRNDLFLQFIKFIPVLFILQFMLRIPWIFVTPVWFIFLVFFLSSSHRITMAFGFDSLA